MIALRRRHLPAFVAALIGGGTAGGRAEPTDKLAESYKASLSSSMSNSILDAVKFAQAEWLTFGVSEADVIWSAAERSEWEVDHYVNVGEDLASVPLPLGVWVRRSSAIEPILAVPTDT